MMLVIIPLQEAAARVEEGNPTIAIAQQHVAYAKDGAKAVSYDLPLGTVRGSTHMMTDAQFRISSIKGDAEELIRNVSKRADLQQAAAAATYFC